MDRTLLKFGAFASIIAAFITVYFVLKGALK